VERTQAVQPAFQLTPDNAYAVAEICAHLDGLPLAIELAAARIKLLPPQAMLVQLREAPLQLLTGGARDLPARQQTLRGTIQWSYDLLNADEQRVFRWLSVFVVGARLRQQKVICEQASLDNLDSLVNKSLLGQHEIDHSPRLSLLETIREFGLEQLIHKHELESARRAHATYYLTFAEDAERQLTGANQKNWLQRLDREQDNLRRRCTGRLNNSRANWLIARLARCSRTGFCAATGVRVAVGWKNRWPWTQAPLWIRQSGPRDSTGGHAGPLSGRFCPGADVVRAEPRVVPRPRRPNGVLKALVQLCRIAAFQDDQNATKVFLAEAAPLIDSCPIPLRKQTPIRT